MSENILIVGSNGFIGSNIISRITPNFNIIGIGKKKSSTAKNIKYLSSDISDADCSNKVFNQIKQVDILIHTAAHIPKSNNDFETTRINCLGAITIKRIIEKFNPRLVIHISSIPIIGIPKYLPITEDHPPNPMSTYHATKLFTENILMQCSDIAEIINLRIPSPLGIKMNPKTIIPVMLNNCINDKEIILFGKGSRRQNYVDVDDIVSCILKIISSSKVNISGIYNLGAAETISNYDLAKICIEINHSNSEIVFSSNPDLQDGLNWHLDTSKVESTFGFRPIINLKDSLLKISNSIKSGSFNFI